MTLTDNPYSVADRGKTPLAYEITDETYEAARKKLETVPPDQWPSIDILNAVYLGVRLYQMEKAETAVKDEAQ